MMYKAKFGVGTFVRIDLDKSIEAIVVQVAFKSEENVTYEISYWNNGDLKVAWVDEWRLSEV